MSHPSVTHDSGPPSPDPPDGDETQLVCPPGYELLEEVGRGGMGVVYRARDIALDRELALKFLQEKYTLDSTTASRFVEEARITAQLQHPGIPPIHQVGKLPDGRPYLAMKLVRGRTLAELIEKDGPHPTRWLGIFEAMCQAVGYAHAHGVVHRDLKPANVMVGGHGEVQVMDWGLAKVLGAPSNTSIKPSSPAETIELRTEIRSIRESDGSMTMAGSILGTPQFMPPEQAAGEIDKISERTDVFGLGAVLCVLLTGQPPFEGATAESTRLNAVRGKTEAAFARLDECGAEPEYVALCKRCLAFEPADRPARGSDLAEAVAAIRMASEERAKRAELDRATSAVQSREQLKRRKLYRVAAGIAAGILGLGIVGTTFGLIRAEKARELAEVARNDEADQRTIAESRQQEADSARKKAQSRLESAIAMVDRMTVRVNGTQWAMNPDLQDERRQILEEAIGLIGELAGDDSRDPLVRREIARANHRVGEMYMLLGRQPESSKAVGQAIRLFDELLAEKPGNVDYLIGAAEARLVEGALFSLASQFDGAVVAYEKARSLAEEAARQEPTNRDHKRRILQARTSRAYLYLLGDPGKGAEAVKETLAFAREIGGSPDAPFSARFELGFALTMAGTFALNRADFPAAVAQFREADGIFQSLGGQTAPTAREAERLLQSRAMAGIQLGLAEMIQARSPDEMRRIAGDVGRGIAILDGLLAIQPKLATYQLQKLQGMTLLAQIDRQLEDWADFARQVRSIRAVEINLTEGRLNFQWTQQIAVRVLSLHAVDEVQAGNVAFAVTEAERLMSFADQRHRTFVKYNAACVFSLASDRDATRRDEYANRAMALLGELKQEDYFLNPANARQFDRDTDLAALRERADWIPLQLAVVKEYLAAARMRMKPESLELANELANAGRALLERKSFAEAEPILKECLAIREKLAPQHVSTFNARSLLGGAYLGQKHYSEAEPLLAAGYDGLRQSKEELPSIARNAVFEAGFRLMELYSQMGRTNKAAAIRQGLPREAAPAARVKRKRPSY